MVLLITQKDFRNLQKLPFCYLCGKDFVANDDINRDHLPAECLFAKTDRESLWLPTHVTCNKSHELTDEKIGELIKLRRRQPPRHEHSRLKFALSPDMRHGAVINVDIDGAVWRWVQGFHAAMYREPLHWPLHSRALITPFPRAREINGRIVVEQVLPQHLVIVEAIKTNRVKDNLDRICCNNGKLTYECVWRQSDDKRSWCCMFALDIYDWKDLGRTRLQPARGCCGYYVLPSGKAPTNATRYAKSTIALPNYDRLDPFRI